MNIHLTALFLLVVASVAVGTAHELNSSNFNNHNNKGKAQHEDFLKFDRKLQEDDLFILDFMSAQCLYGTAQMQGNVVPYSEGMQSADVPMGFFLVFLLIILQVDRASLKDVTGESEVPGDSRRKLRFDNPECHLFDFGTNATAVEAFSTACNGMGGQTLTINAYGSASCEVVSYFLRHPACLARGLCSKEDVSGFATFFATPTLPVEDSLCEYEVAVVSDGGNEEGDSDIQLPDVPGTCFADMVKTTFLYNDVYEDIMEYVIDESTGEFTGNNTALEIFTDLCESKDGRLIQASIYKYYYTPSNTTSNNDYSSECDRNVISSVPLCVAASCNDEHAELVLNVFLQDTFNNPDLPCQHVTMTIDGTSGPSSKSTKGSKSSKSTEGKRSKSAWEY